MGKEEVESQGDEEASSITWDMTMLRVAIRALDPNAVTNFLKTGIDLQTTFTEPRKYRTALHDLVATYCERDAMQQSAFMLGQFMQILTLFTDTGLDIHDSDVTGQTALHLAAGYPGSKDVVEILLRLGAHVHRLDRSQQSALHKAAASGGAEVCVVLVEAGAKIDQTDSRGFTPLIVAAKRRNNTETIKQLIKLGAYINFQEGGQTKCGPTALHIACRHGNPANVSCLLKHAAQVDLREGGGQTPVHIAAVHDMNGDIMNKLMQARSSVHSADDVNGDTPLHKAIAHSMNHLVYILLKCGANIFAMNSYGDTVLHVAALHCRDVSVWTALLRGKASIRVKTPNRQGLSAKDKAMRCKNQVALNMLKQYEETPEAKSPRLPQRSTLYASVEMSPVMRRNISA